MKLHRIIQKINSGPWYLTSHAMSTIQKVLETRMRIEDVPSRNGQDLCGEDVELEGSFVLDGILEVPVAGIIGQGLRSFEKSMGAVDVLDIRAEMQSIMDDDAVRGVFLDIDSPGGMVNGTPEAADFIRGFDKPVIAFSRGMMASAAYYLAAAADAIVTTPSADVGSIGVIFPFIDTSAHLEKNGVSMDMIISGDLKGTAFPGTSLSDKQRAYLQDGVDEAHANFKDFVTENRHVDDEDMQGQTFSGRGAMHKGLVDINVESREQAIDMFKKTLTEEGF